MWRPGLMLWAAPAMIFAAAATQPAATQSATTSDARQVLERALRAYRSVQSYQDECTLQFETEMASGRTLPPAQQESRLTYAAPNRAAVVTPVMHLYADGSAVRLLLPGHQQYVEWPLDGPLDMHRGGLAEVTFYQVSHPILWALAQPGRSPDEVLACLSDLTDAGAQEREGRPGRLIRGAIHMPHLPSVYDVVPWEAWFDDQTHLPGEATLDLSKAHQDYGPQEGPAAVKKKLLRMAFKNIRINERVEAAAFTPEVLASAKRVPAFDPPPPRAAEVLVDQWAPPFEAYVLDDHLVRLAAGDTNVADVTIATLKDFAGRPLLLAFWNPSCGPCVLGLHDLQTLADRYADRLTVVGVLGGEAMNAAGVQKYLQREKITFRQLVDQGNILTRGYHPGVLPCFVMIDAQGVLREMRYLYLPGQGKRLTAMVERELAASKRRAEEAKVIAGLTVRRFLDEVRADHETAAVGMTWPEMLPTSKLVEVRRSIDVNGLVVGSAFHDDGAGLVVTQLGSGAQPARRVVFELLRVDMNWLITGIEIVDEAGANQRMARFLQDHPAALPEDPVPPHLLAVATATAPATTGSTD